MNKRRLLKLADLLEADAKNKNGIRFDLSDWGSVEDPKKPMSCGTTACAMGLAALSGAFKRQGLKAKIVKLGWVDIVLGGTSGGFDAAEVLFEITCGAACWLFDPAYYRGDKTGSKGERSVAKRIRDFVDGKVQPPL